MFRLMSNALLMIRPTLLDIIRENLYYFQNWRIPPGKTENRPRPYGRAAPVR